MNTLYSSRHPSAVCVTGGVSLVWRVGQGWVSAGNKESPTQLTEQEDFMGWGWEGFL